MSLIAGALLGGAVLNYVGGRQNSSDMADANQANIDMTYDLADTSIQRRVADAEAAGINPYYAIGAPTMSPSVPIQSTRSGDALAGVGNVLTQGAQIASNLPGQQQSEIQSMNHELMQHQLAEARKAGELPPLFIQAIDPNPNSVSFGKKVWVFNPDLESEGMISNVGFVYQSTQEAIKALKDEIKKTIDQASDNPVSKSFRIGEAWEQIRNKYNVPNN